MLVSWKAVAIDAVDLHRGLTGLDIHLATQNIFKLLLSWVNQASYHWCDLRSSGFRARAYQSLWDCIQHWVKCWYKWLSTSSAVLEMFECELFVHLAGPIKTKGQMKSRQGCQFIKTEALTIRLASYLIADLVLWTWEEWSVKGIWCYHSIPELLDSSGKMVTWMLILKDFVKTSDALVF